MSFGRYTYIVMLIIAILGIPDENAIFCLEKGYENMIDSRPLGHISCESHVTAHQTIEVWGSFLNGL